MGGKWWKDAGCDGSTNKCPTYDFFDHKPRGEDSLMHTLVHLLDTLAIGGKERGVLQLTKRARQNKLDHRIVLFDSPFRENVSDLAPGDVPIAFVRRRPGLDFTFAFKLASLFRNWRVQIVHTHNDTALFYGALAVKLLTQCAPSLIATFHALPSHPTRMARLATAWAARQADAVTAVSPDLKRFLIERRWIDRCVTLWTSVDLNEFCPTGPKGEWRHKLGVPKDALLVATVGRLDTIKRQQDLIEAARISECGLAPSLCFVFAGQGPTESALRAQAADRHNVRFVSHISNVPAFLRDVDIFVLCSEYDAAPRALLEAMACGRAIIATAVGGIPEMLTLPDGSIAGRLISPFRSDLISKHLLDLSVCQEERVRLGHLARERAKAFSTEREWEEHARLYQTIKPSSITSA
jgi:L-malate glycosyltransferase